MQISIKITAEAAKDSCVIDELTARVREERNPDLSVKDIVQHPPWATIIWEAP